MIVCRVIPSLASMLANLASPDVSSRNGSYGDLKASESHWIQSSCLSSPDAVTTAATTWDFQTSRSCILGHAGMLIFSCSFRDILEPPELEDEAAPCSVAAAFSALVRSSSYLFRYLFLSSLSRDACASNSIMSCWFCIIPS